MEGFEISFRVQESNLQKKTFLTRIVRISDIVGAPSFKIFAYILSGPAAFFLEKLLIIDLISSELVGERKIDEQFEPLK